MIYNKKIVVVLPAYNASKTLEHTFKEIPFDIVDDVIFVDDASTDNTVEVAKKIGIKTVAEFVETQEILDNLKELEIDFAQGYFTGKPQEWFIFDKFNELRLRKYKHGFLFLQNDLG